MLLFIIKIVTLSVSASDAKVGSLQEHLVKFQSLATESVVTSEKLEELNQQFTDEFASR